MENHNEEPKKELALDDIARMVQDGFTEVNNKIAEVDEL